MLVIIRYTDWYMCVICLWMKTRTLLWDDAPLSPEDVIQKCVSNQNEVMVIICYAWTWMLISLWAGLRPVIGRLFWSCCFFFWYAVCMLACAQGPGSSEQTWAPEGSGEQKEGANSQGSEGGAGGPQEKERPGDRAHEKAKETRAGKWSKVGTESVIYIIVFDRELSVVCLCVCAPSAGAGATENWGRAGEHPRVCEDEEQPAQDQAGDWRRGTNHLKPAWVSGSGWLCACLWARRRQECVYKRERESVWWWPDRGPRKTSWLSQTSCSFPQWGEWLYRLRTTPLSACHGLPVLTSAPHTHPAGHSTPCRRDLSQTCYTPFNEGEQASTMGKQANIHTGVLFPSVFSPLATASCRFSLLFSVLLLSFRSLSSFLSSESNKEKWTLDGLLKLCNVKAKQKRFCYLCL